MGGNTIKIAFNGSKAVNSAYIEKLITACERAAEMGFRVILSLDTEDNPQDNNNVRQDSLVDKERREQFWRWLGESNNTARIKRSVDIISPVNEPAIFYNDGHDQARWNEAIPSLVDYVRTFMGDDFLCSVSPNIFAAHLSPLQSNVIERRNILLDIHPYRRVLWETADQHYTVDSLPAFISKIRSNGIPVIFSEYGYTDEGIEVEFSRDLVSKVIKPLNMSALRYGLVSEYGTLSLLDESGKLRAAANQDDWTSTMLGMTI
jgi:hypothetical protein